MVSPRAGFGLVSLKTGDASDHINILAIGGIKLNRESVSHNFLIILTYSNEDYGHLFLIYYA